MTFCLKHSYIYYNDEISLLNQKIRSSFTFRGKTSVEDCNYKKMNTILPGASESDTWIPFPCWRYNEVLHLYTIKRFDKLDPELPSQVVKKRKETGDLYLQSEETPIHHRTILGALRFPNSKSRDERDKILDLLSS